MVPNLRVLIKDDIGTRTFENAIAINPAFIYSESDVPHCEQPPIKDKIDALRAAVFFEVNMKRSITKEDAVKIGNLTKEYLIDRSQGIIDCQKKYKDKLENFREKDWKNLSPAEAVDKFVRKNLMGITLSNPPVGIIFASNNLVRAVNDFYSAHVASTKVQNTIAPSASTATGGMFAKTSTITASDLPSSNDEEEVAEQTSQFGCRSRKGFSVAS